MGTLVSINHKTTYRYDRPVRLGPQLIRLRPAAHARTKIPSYALTVEPKGHFINWIQDPWGNFMARILFPDHVSHFTMTVDLVADLAVFNPFDFFVEPWAETLPFTPTANDNATLIQDLAAYTKPVVLGPLMAEYVKTLPPAKGRTIDFLVALNQKVQGDIKYRIRMEPNVQTSEDTLALGSGSCRDSAVLLMELCRYCGLAARFVSGYLVQLKPDIKPLVGLPGPEVDFTDLHAWTEVYLPGAGWVGLDPTSGLLAGEGHIPLAATPHPANAAPLEGLLEQCKVDFEYTMSVTRLVDLPRASKPFPQGNNQALLDLGRAIDQRLEAQNVKLTIGGEPTFVSENNRADPQWNGEALGDEKKELATQLLHRLVPLWAKGGVTHFRQGKWYPGESLPRWALSCYWRKDGVPVWKNPALLAPGTASLGYSHADALSFLKALTDTLGVESKFIIEAYEDPVHFLRAEARLPINVSPGDPKLANPEDRHRMVQVFTHGLDKPTGYVLPLQKGSWKSGPWPLREGKLVLIPGDSPIGLRLPLDSLPWAERADKDETYEHDPFEDYNRIHHRRAVGGIGHLDLHPEPLENLGQKVNEQVKPLENPPLVEGESAAWIVRTALCAQVRDGNLYLFLPPVRKAEDWFALVAEIETTAERLGVKVILEGYEPPHGDSFTSFHITPDPGVIEVNLPPAANSSEWQGLLTQLWDQAAKVGLSTVKYLVGGQEAGSGGGCHWVLGGPSPSQSPFLKRPDLLRSWILYLNHHPALSYVFSGLFVGPTSQAPRFDEANPWSHADLELAFREVDKDHPPAPWLTDRIFRNLMVDGSGNTHRTELCIDKLFSPDRSSGRLGLVEFRSFEMAPHVDMALSQSQLLRALTLVFLEQPYLGPLKRWSTALKDTWMLPYYLGKDLEQILEFVGSRGLRFPLEPFTAHMDFRFPLLGTFEWDGCTFELRQALEPWPVMGEEGSPGGTVRYVDSSVERIEITARNFDPTRYALSCGGLQVPLSLVDQETMTFVAGLRFKAWHLASGLHPTIKASPSISLDLVDLLSQAVVSGCTYHVAHPAGRNYEEPPVNSFEAEARRMARFVPGSHSPGPLKNLPRLVISDEYPHTLSVHGHYR